jgi:hypothetical protein
MGSLSLSLCKSQTTTRHLRSELPSTPVNFAVIRLFEDKPFAAMMFTTIVGSGTTNMLESLWLLTLLTVESTTTSLATVAAVLCSA